MTLPDLPPQISAAAQLTPDSAASDSAASGTSVPPATIDVQGLCHWYGTGALRKQVLFDVDLTVRRGEIVYLTGPSGCGKTTILTLVGCLRSIQSGDVSLVGQPLAGASKSTLVTMRRKIGFIFQAHNLHRSLTALQNVRMGLEVHGRDGLRDWRGRAAAMLEAVGLGGHMDYLPGNLSGGQKQRVAIARALVHQPPVILADEPTAALDKTTGRAVVDLLVKLARDRGTTILMVTHDNRILDAADRTVAMEDGRIRHTTGG